MTSRDQDLDRSQARDLWARASEMERQEEQKGSRTVPALPAPTEGLSVRSVLEVAEEVGISPACVLMALGEDRLHDAHELRRVGAARRGRWTEFLLESVDALDVRLEIPASPQAVDRAVGRVMEKPEFRLTLEDREGSDPDRPMLRTYRIPGTGAFGSSSHLEGAMELADGRVVLVVLEPSPTGTLLRLRMPTFGGGGNATLSGSSAGLVGFGGGSAGLALGESVAGLAGLLSGLGTVPGVVGLVSLALMVGPTMAGAALGAGAGVWGFRRLQRWGFGKGETALSGSYPTKSDLSSR